MLFNSYQFLIFFPIVTLLYFIVPHKLRWLHLLLASCVFYMAFIPAYIFILLFTIIIDYVAGIVIENASGKKRRSFLILSIINNTGVLCVFKYYNFFTDNVNGLLKHLHIYSTEVPYLNIILPIGLSFHTFQAMSYTIEVYRNKQKAERHFGIYALYVMFYPQLVAGPIERPQNLLHQFREKHSFDTDRVTSGLRLMMWGLFKKVVIADQLSIIVKAVYSAPANFSGPSLLLAVFFFSYQIFCDFSGYSDIAIGSARVMGFDLMQNFNAPYLSKSIAQFWRKWHISLSTWFKDYVYIPLGGNKVSTFRWCLNILVVFTLSGLWHGANWTFVIWGALHGVYLIIERLIKKNKTLSPSISLSSKIGNTFSTIFTFMLVTIAWVFFRANNATEAFYIIEKIPQALKGIFSGEHLNYFGVSKVVIVSSFLLIALLELYHYFKEKVDIIQLFEKQHAIIRWGVYYIAIIAVFYSGQLEGTQFIYFQF